MSNRRVGLWLVGACGGVGSTAALGLAALSQGLADTTSLTTALPLFDGVDLDAPSSFVVGGHEIRKAGFRQGVRDLHERSGVFDAAVLAGCDGLLAEWERNLRPGTVLGSGPTIAKLAEQADRTTTPREAIDRIKKDLGDFKARHRLDQAVVVNVSSTEPPFETGEEHGSLAKLDAALDRPVLPASSMYAYAALDLGMPFVNFTPSLGATLPALEELAVQRGTTVCGKDGKTGETLMKTVLAPMFALRNWRIMSWVGHNIFGNRDGQVLDDPVNKASKIKTKDQVVSGIVGYKPQTHVSIEYIESLDDWKTAWNHIHFKGFLGTKMIMQVIWQGCDSLLAAPLVLDLARLSLLSQRRKETGVLAHLACFFKNPQGVAVHDVFKQFAMLQEYVAGLGS
ncbi:MAG: inositol-3-phosphate synthase [Gemmataceae bacterium]|nr:inositol-3-phosphate synthase [Gemmataceae bacterium]